MPETTTSNVICVDFTPTLSPPQLLRSLEQETRELRREILAGVNRERVWRAWERQRLLARIRSLRAQLAAERANQFDDEAVYDAAEGLQRETGPADLSASAVAARLVRQPTHSAVVRVGLALSRLEAAGRIVRVRRSRPEGASRWRVPVDAAGGDV